MVLEARESHAGSPAPRSPRVTGPTAIGPTEIGVEQARVMVIDDDAALVRMVRMTLVAAGMHVSTAVNGEVALDAVTDARPDVIVLDLQMPVMDGRTFFRELRQRGSTVPVLILSAYGARPAQDELGAEGSIAKPFDPADLVAAIQRLLPDDPSPAP